MQSRTVSGTLEHAVVGGASRIVLGPDDSAIFGVVATSAIEQAVCVLTGTTTKQ